MAVGDITTVINAGVANNGAITRQPSSGVEEQLLCYGSNQRAGHAIPNDYAALDVGLTNGSQFPIIYDDSSETIIVGGWGQRIVFDNTNYLQMINRSGSSADLCSVFVVVG